MVVETFVIDANGGDITSRKKIDTWEKLQSTLRYINGGEACEQLINEEDLKRKDNSL